jgi:signal transduction histidine kinase
MLELGEQLIKNESVAILELIKNGYDAFALNVTVDLLYLDDIERGHIIIQDDGIGMSRDIVENHWMEPATSNKKKLVEECKKPIVKNGVYRVPLGEKGIGRFGAHKLGNHIILISKSEDSENEVFFEINWNDFDSDRYLDEIEVHIYERTPKIFLDGATGTRIEIDCLKHKWLKGEFRNVYKNILMLNSPFKANNSFNVKVTTTHQDWISDLLKYENFIDRALFKAHIEVKDDKITAYQYEFIPWSVLRKVSHRVNTKYTGTELYDFEEKTKLSLKPFAIGKIVIDLNIFDLDGYVLNLGFQNDKRLLKEYLKQNGGISIYRDNMRLYEYGDASNDWLGLGNRRINNPTKTLSSRIIVGAVYLERLASGDLIEKTSREGFIENAAYNAFVKAVLFAISCVENDRMLDKADLRINYSTSFKEPVVDSVKSLMKMIDKKVKDNEIKKQINSALSNIEREYKEISAIYVKSSSIGLNMSIIIHEIEKIIIELKTTVSEEGVSSHIKNLVSDLETRISSYSELIKNTKTKDIELSKLVSVTLNIFKYRIRAHKLHIDNKILYSEDKVTCADSLVRSAIMNILDNSIYWLEKNKIAQKSILFDHCEVGDGYKGLLIVDNGKGFTLPKDRLTIPFISKKEDGMGLGLHLVEEIMNTIDGKLIFPNNNDLDLPEQYKEGAAIILAFKEA